MQRVIRSVGVTGWINSSENTECTSITLGTINHHLGMRKTAKNFGNNYRALSRFVKKFSREEMGINKQFPTTSVRYVWNREIFTDSQEKSAG